MSAKRSRGAVGVVFVVAVGAAIGASCGGSSTPPAESPPTESSSSGPATKPLDCKFVSGEANCWKPFAATVSACLGGRIHPTGKLSADLTECALEDDVKVKLGSSCDPDKDCDVHEVYMGRGDKKCLEFHANITKPADEFSRGVGSFEIGSAQGTMKVEWDEKSKTITCPDGSVYTGSGDWKKELKDCADTSGYDGIPTYAFTKAPSVMEGKKKKAGTGTLSFELSTMDVLFECSKP